MIINYYYKILLVRENETRDRGRERERVKQRVKERRKYRTKEK